MDNNNGADGNEKSGLGLHNEALLGTPKMYRVILLNDHYTTMDFVVAVLIKVFHKSAAEATKIMLDVHKKGSGVCGVYTYDVAVTKISEVEGLAREQDFPLKCRYEEA